MTDIPNRTIEMYRIQDSDSSTWDTVMVEIPANTDPNRIEEVGRIHAAAQYGSAAYMLYNSMDGDCPETDIPIRLQKWVILFFDADQTTEGTDIEQGRAAVAQVNDVLSRQPYGLGASLTELPITGGFDNRFEKTS